MSDITKDTFPGVGDATVKKLKDVGYPTTESLAGVSVETLVEKGIAKRQAEAIVNGIGSSGAKKEDIKVVEGKTKKGKAYKPAPKAEVVEKAYAAKIKPELSDAVKDALRTRAARHKREPEFKRYHWYFKASLEQNAGWRRPRGNQNKQRRGFNYRPPRVKIGWGKPNASKFLHPSGFAEVPVFNVNDLSKIEPKTQAARIGGTVGARKHKLIEAKAAELKIRVLNPLQGGS